MPRGKGFQRKAPPRREPKQTSYVARPREQACRIEGLEARMSVPVPKREVLRSEAYRRLVAALPCINCGAWGRSQAAHPNTDKGMGMKTDDRLCFPLCGPSFSEPGCHAAFDQGALMSKEARRLVEPRWGAQTRQAIEAQRLWPKNLPRITDERETAGEPA
jgi:hypothetical protein